MHRYSPGITLEIYTPSDQREIRERGVVMASGFTWVLLYLPGEQYEPRTPDYADSYQVIDTGQVIVGSQQRFFQADPGWVSWTWAMIERAGRGLLGNEAIAQEWETAAALMNRF